MLLLLLALAIVVASTSITSAEPGKLGHRPAAPLFDYSSLSLPPEHIPYFLRNNQGVSKLCHQDPLCPFKVRYQPFCGWVGGCVHLCQCLDMRWRQIVLLTTFILVGFSPSIHLFSFVRNTIFIPCERLSELEAFSHGIERDLKRIIMRQNTKPM